jgi:hypothetical protein
MSAALPGLSVYNPARRIDMNFTVTTRRAVATALLILPLSAVGQTSLMAQNPAPHKNFIQRHPTATGFAAGMVTHHELKVAAARDKRRHHKLNWAERHPTLSAIGVGAVTRHEVIKHTPQ